MTNCKHLTKEMLNHPVQMRVDDMRLNFCSAKAIADRKAHEMSSDPMLVAWFDRNGGKFSPDTICCDREKPSWLVYAESRGADISVDINDQDYVFVYKSAFE